MRDSHVHLSDRELLLAADNELIRGRSAQAQAHLNACPACRERLREVEALLEDVSVLHRSSLDPLIQDAADGRARLKVRLHELSGKSSKASWSAPEYAAAIRPRVAYACAALFIAAVTILAMHERPRRITGAVIAASVAPAPVPERRLTPGVARPVTSQEICRLPSEGNNADVPPMVRRAVFQEYGIANGRPEDYEVDYLISPTLGGTASMGNLWPEPYSAVWNAHVKDALENRLHELVCDGHVPLATAQRDISTDWISAYKKYFGSDRPLSGGDVIKDSRPEPNS